MIAGAVFKSTSISSIIGLRIEVSDGRSESLPLEPCAVADFYRQIMDRLKALGFETRIWTVPVELPDPIRV